jgi:WD40 repeat protein
MRCRLKRPIVLLLGIALLFSSLGALDVGAVQAQPGERCFEATGYCMSGRIREFWEQNDGLRVFGLPIGPQRAEEIEGKSIQVQWFQRNRLELHPENAPPFDVLLGRLGADRLMQQSRNPDAFQNSPGPQPRCRYFEPTGHNVCGRMLRAWQSNGLEIDGQPGYTEQESLALFGMPLSNERSETLSDGQVHTVQWFERARFEIHYFPTDQVSLRSEVLFGLLGNEIVNGPNLDDVPPPPPPGSPQERIAYQTNSGIDTRLFPGADAGQVRYIHTMNTYGSDIEVLTRNHVQIDKRPDWSPDGSRIVFESPRDSGLPDIYRMDATGANIVRLTTNPGADGYPAWSPDGSQIAYASDETGDFEIYVMGTDGANKRRVTNNPGRQDIHPTWSPDGSRIAYTSNSGQNRGEWDIYSIPTGGGSPTNLSQTAADDQSPSWSANNQIAFKSLRDGNWEIYVMNADGSGQRNASNHPAADEEPAWSPNGQRIAFQTNRLGASEIFLMDASGENQTNISNDPATNESPAWSRPIGAPPPHPCPHIPQPVNALISPQRCASTGDQIVIDIYGFLANEQYNYSVIGIDRAGNVVTPFGPRVDQVDEYGQSQVALPPGTFAPGDYRLEFTFNFSGGAFYGSTVYLTVN